MNLVIRSKIRQVNVQDVYRIFDFQLLSELSPPFMRPIPVLYEGSALGSRMHFRLKTPFGLKDWKGEICAEGIGTDEIFFVDRGSKMPFGIIFWEHTHRISQKGLNVIISDELVFRSAWVLTDLLLYPGILFQFLYRKPLYEKIIKRRLSQGSQFL